MNFQKAKFITSMTKYDPDKVEELPQIAVVGKSNVGKSSFINMVTRNGKLSKVGKTPGKTRLINWFLIDEAMYLVDLPGYGYAKRSKQELESWGRMIEDYLMTSRQLAAIVLLYDIRHDPTREDRMMYDWVMHYQISPVLVCTKAEKIAKSKRKAQCDKIAKVLGHSGEILAVDSVSGFGRDQVLEKMEENYEKMSEV